MATLSFNAGLVIAQSVAITLTRRQYCVDFYLLLVFVVLINLSERHRVGIVGKRADFLLASIVSGEFPRPFHTQVWLRDQRPALGNLRSRASNWTTRTAWVRCNAIVEDLGDTRLLLMSSFLIDYRLQARCALTRSARAGTLGTRD